MPSKKIRRKLARKKLEEELQAPPAEPEPKPEPEPEPEPCPYPDQCCCDDGPIQCIYIIQRGKRKGQECGKKCKEGLYCSLHTEKAIEY
mgnify:FL=1